MDDSSDTAFYIGIASIAIVIFLVGLLLLGFLTTPRLPCASDPISQACIDYRIGQCLKTERYTMDQCVTLIGGGK